MTTLKPDLCDVIEVQLDPPHAVRLIDIGKTKRNAEAIVEMAVMRRGVEAHFFTTVPAGTYRDGDRYYGADENKWKND